MTETKLDIKSRAETIQLVVISDETNRPFWRLTEPTHNWTVNVPKSAFPYLTPGMGVLASITLTSISVVELPDEPEGLINSTGQPLAAKPSLLLPPKGRSN